MNNKELRDAIADFIDISHWTRPMAVTLTCKFGIMTSASYIRIDEDKARQNLRHVCNVLNKRLFGNAVRKGAKIEIVPVLEHNAEGRLHYHIALNVPEGMEHRDVEQKLVDIWRQSNFGHREADVQSMDRGWVDYMLKPRSKKDYDLAIDWENLHLNSKV